MGRGSFLGSFGRTSDAAVYRSYPYQLPGLGECVALPEHIPQIPQRLGAAHPKPPSTVNMTWRAACEGEQLARQQASLISHASWWTFALSDNLFDLEPADVAKAMAEAAVWAQAGLTVTTKALEANQTLLAQYLLLRRDAVLEQTGLPRGRSSILRAAPLESPDLLGPKFDELTSTWTLEDEQAKTLGGGKTSTFQKRPVRQGGKMQTVKPNEVPARTSGKTVKTKQWWRDRSKNRGNTRSGPKPPQGGPNRPPPRK